MYASMGKKKPPIESGIFKYMFNNESGGLKIKVSLSARLVIALVLLYLLIHLS
jgi:hypothetical protein